MEDDGELSSSEGSTVDGMAAGERVESVDFELEESMDPDECFPDGEYGFSYCHHNFYSQGVVLISPFSLLSLHTKVPVLPGECGCGLLEGVVDATKDLLPNSGA